MILGFQEFSFYIFKSHELLIFFLIEVKYDEIVKFSFSIVFYEELALLQSRLDLLLVDLTI